ncbi:MAG: 6-phosphogluconolactonase [Pseudomonadota bacterium]
MNFESFHSRAAASAFVARQIIAALNAELARANTATLVVSGGTTPQACFAELASSDLPWRRIKIALSDEREVPVDHPDSNQRMLRTHLLTRRAAEAEYVDLSNLGTEAFAAVLVGMGEDGHFASIFPDADNLASAIALDNPAATIEVATAASPHLRRSMTLARLLNSHETILLCFGAAKRTILDAPENYPVADLLQQDRSPVTVVWAE